MKRASVYSLIVGLLIVFVSYGVQAQTIIDFDDMPGDFGYGPIFGDDDPTPEPDEPSESEMAGGFLFSVSGKEDAVVLGSTNGGYGVDGGTGCLSDNSLNEGEITRWTIRKADNESFQFRGIYLANKLGSPSGTITAVGASGNPIGDPVNVGFDGTYNTSFISNEDFWDVKEIWIDADDLNLFLDHFTYGDPVSVGDDDPAEVLGITLVGSPNSTETTVSYAVTFSKDALHVDVSDFELTTTGSAVGTIAGVSGSGTSYTVVIDNISGEGSLRLDLKAGTNIENDDGTTGTAPFTGGQVHYVGSCFTETFDQGETNGTSTFSGNGKTFTLTGNWTVNTESPPNGLDGSAFNVKGTGTDPFTITVDAGVIAVPGLYLYVSSLSDGLEPTNNGSVTIRGLRSGTEVYTFTKSTGFNTTLDSISGYSFIDFSSQGTDGIEDYSEMLIDQLEISLGGSFIYLNLDNFSWCLDFAPPSGYSVSIDQDPIMPANETAVSFTFSDAEIGTTYNYTFSSDGGGTDVAGSGSIATATDQVTDIDLSGLNPGTVTLRVTLTDASGNVGAEVTDEAQKIINYPPTDIDLDNSSVNQSAGENAVVGTLDTEDEDEGDAHSYSLVSGEGDNSNGSFNISGATLRANDATALAAGTHSVRIQTDDGNGGTYPKSFTITVVDDIEPAVSSVTVPTNGTYAIGQHLDFTVNLSENVTVTGEPSIPLTIGGESVSANYVSGSGTTALVFRHTVQEEDWDADGVELGSTIDLNGGTIADGAGNGLNLALNLIGNTEGVLVDGVPPAVTDVDVPTPGLYGIGETLRFTVNADETVDVTSGTPRIPLTIGTTTRYADYVSGTGSAVLVFEYTVQSGDSESSVAVGGAIDLNGASITDLPGNAMVTTLNNTGSTADVVADGMRPTAAIDIDDMNLIAGETTLVTITFSEAVTGFDNNDVIAPNGSLSTFSSNDGGITWTATFTPTSGMIDATNVMTLDNTGVSDLAGNAGTGTTESDNYSIDTQRPTATITVEDVGLHACATAEVEFTFTKAVSGFDNDDLTIPHGTLTAVTSSDGGITWTATFTPDLNVQETGLQIILDNTGVADGSGNTGLGTTSSNTFDINSMELALTGSQTNVSCFDAADGTATVDADGGTGPYTYSWNTTPVQTTATAIGLSAGTYTVTVTDGCGSETSYEFEITTAEDVEDPQITCLANQAVSADADECFYTYSGTGWDATATDNCSVASITYVLSGATTGSGTSLDGITFNTGATQVTWTAEDAGGNTATCQFTITVSSNVPLVVDGPGEFSGTTPNTVAAVISSTDLWSPNGSNAVMQTLDNAFGSGNWDHYTDYATVDPQLLFGGEYGYVYLEGGDETATAFTTFIATNRTLIEDWVYNGGHLLMNAAPNEGGNIDLGFGGFTLQYNLSVTGNTEGIVQVSGHPAFNGPLTPANGNFTGGYFAHGIVAPVGATFTTLLKGENDGRIVIETPYGSGLVAFGGLTPPNFHSPAPNSYNWISNFHTYLSQPVDKPYLVVVSTDDDGCEYTAVDGALDPTITDPCNIGYTISHDYVGAPNTHTLDGTVFPSGDHTVKWTIEDGNGNTYVRSTIVRIEDSTLPVISCVANQSIGTDPGVCTYTHTGTAWDATATDNCTESPTVSYELTGATTGTGATLDGVVFNPGETIVTWTATDDAGNTDICSFTVTVDDNENPVVTCVGNQSVNTDADECTYTHTGAAWDATATDNCTASPVMAYVLDGATAGTGSTLDGVVFNLGETTVTWTATDDAGNTDVCSFNVVVVDEDAPTVLTRNIIVALDADGQATITPEMVDDGSYDACGIATLLLSKTTFNSDDLGSNTVTLIATDQNGNESDPILATVIVVTFDDNRLIYDGTAKSLSIAGDLPSGVDVMYTDNGQIDAGVYTVTATIDGGDDFNDLVLTAELEITNASLVGVIALEDGSFMYDGTAKALAIDGTLPAGTDVAYVDNSRTDVGTQEVTATVSGDNYDDLVLIADLTITPATITGITLEDGSFVYDGSTQSLAITGDLPDGTTVSYADNSRTDVGTQEVTATVSGDNYDDLVLTADLTITPAAITGITLEDGNFVYDGEAKALTINGTLPDGTTVSYADNSRTGVGTQEVTATITGDNYEDLVLTAELTITPATITGITLEDGSFVYDGTAKALAIDGTLPSGTSVTYTDNSRTDVGTQEVTATITSDNYDDLVLTAELTITSATITGVKLEDGSFVYDGTVKALAIDGTLPSGTSVSYADNSRTDVGTQEVTATITGDNYDDLVLTADLTVTQATRTLAFPALPVKTYGDADFAGGATASSGEAVTYTSSDPSVVEITAGGQLRITGAGETTITATVPENSNYTTRPRASQTLVVRKAGQTITFNAPAEVDRGAGTVRLDVSASSGLPVALTLDDPEVASLEGTSLNILRLGTVRITATQAGDANHEPAGPVTVTVRVTDPTLDLPILVSKAVSPNGDGINEYLIIEAIRDYPENRVRIFNRNGTVVWEAGGYDNNRVAFRGIGTGQNNVPAGTYFYVAEIRVGGGWKYEKGWFVLRY